MKLAVQIAKHGLGQTGANPSVGCVIVKNNIIVGRGITGRNGTPHAEQAAIKQAGKSAKEATAFVTLEPCSHFGKTSPCADKLIEAQIKRVVCPLTDPDPRVSGKGFEKLISANISVDFIPTAKPWAEDLAAGFISRILKGRPYVTAKLGVSFDGKIASKYSTSKWITNELARKNGQLLRVQNDAILVGTNTFALDKPSLNTRDAFSRFKTPLRLFLDRKLSIFPEQQVIENLAKLPSILVCGEDPNSDNLDLWQKNKIEILQVPEVANKLDMKYLLNRLADKGINRLLVEGGGEIIADLISNNLIDRLVEYESGIILGNSGVNSIGALSKTPREIEEYPNFKIKSVRQLEDNIEVVREPSNR